MHPSEIIKNSATGDSIEFLQTAEETNGRMSKFIMTLSPKSSWAKKPRHFHPYQTETFEVLSGKLHLSVGSKTYVLESKDEKVTVEKFTLHSFWNTTNEEVKFIAEIFPPKNIEKGIRMTYELSQLGKVNKKNVPYNPFYSLLLMKHFDAYFALVPWRFQKSIFSLGAKLASLLGYK